MLYSWWPSPRQWEAATPNVRYWSPSNERWFVTRLSDIRSGKASWIKTADWPMKLRNNKKTKRLMNKNSELSERFLQSGEIFFFLEGKRELTWMKRDRTSIRSDLGHMYTQVRFH